MFGQVLHRPRAELVLRPQPRRIFISLSRPVLAGGRP